MRVSLPQGGKVYMSLARAELHDAAGPPATCAPVSDDPAPGLGLAWLHVSDVKVLLHLLQTTGPTTRPQCGSFQEGASLSDIM